MAQVSITQKVVSDRTVVQAGPPGFIIALIGETCTWCGVGPTAVSNVVGSATLNSTTDFSMSAAGRYRVKATTPLGDVLVDLLAYESAALAKIPASTSGETMTDARRLRIFAALAHETTWFDGTAASLVSQSLYSVGG
jgi:hypothetical protein